MKIMWSQLKARYSGSFNNFNIIGREKIAEALLQRFEDNFLVNVT